MNIVMELCNIGDIESYTSDRAWDKRGNRACPVPHAEMILITVDMLLSLSPTSTTTSVCRYDPP